MIPNILEYFLLLHKNNELEIECSKKGPTFNVYTKESKKIVNLDYEYNDYEHVNFAGAHIFIESKFFFKFFLQETSDNFKIFTLTLNEQKRFSKDRITYNDRVVFNHPDTPASKNTVSNYVKILSEPEWHKYKKIACQDFTKAAQNISDVSHNKLIFEQIENLQEEFKIEDIIE